MTQPVAMITGGGRQRVGYVIAKSLAEAGYAIALHYHSSGESAKLSRNEFLELGVRCEIFQADLAIESDIQAMCSRVIETFGHVDVLVTTASIWGPTRLEELTGEHLRRNFEINTLGTFLTVRHIGLQMVSQTAGGSIVTIGDWAIERPYADYAAYLVSKGAIPTLTRCLAVELGERNPKVRVNCIHPGPVMLPPHTTPEERETLTAATLTKNVDEPQCMARAVRFFVDNDFVTGVCLPVDGGRTIYSQESHERG